MSRTSVDQFWVKFLSSRAVLSPRRRISCEANGRTVVVYRASAGMRKGADGGHTDCEICG